MPEKRQMHLYSLVTPMRWKAGEVEINPGKPFYFDCVCGKKEPVIYGREKGQGKGRHRHLIAEWAARPFGGAGLMHGQVTSPGAFRPWHVAGAANPFMEG